jgi:bacteriochlorophyllide a dehydrogenase
VDTLAVVVEEPGRVALRRLGMGEPEGNDVVVEVDFSGVSMGTEKLMFTGAMPAFPGMGYPLVPGYESVGRIIDAGHMARGRIGERVFVPGSTKFIGARGLFGGSARHLVTASSRVLSVPDSLGAEAVLLSLAATARHAMAGFPLPDLIIGHGVLGRLLARMTVAAGRYPTVWEINPARLDKGAGYAVCQPDADDRRDYRSVYDASGDPDILDGAIARLGHGGEIVLAGFYGTPLHFHFAPAFRREARFRIAAEFQPDDLAAVIAMVGSGRLSLAGLVSDNVPAGEAATAYPRAFADPACLKMVLDWSNVA